MKSFEVNGTFKEGEIKKKFSKTLQAENQEIAREKALSLMGSNHKTKRIHINIESIKEAKE